MQDLHSHSPIPITNNKDLRVNLKDMTYLVRTALSADCWVRPIPLPHGLFHGDRDKSLVEEDGCEKYFCGAEDFVSGSVQGLQYKL